MYRPVLIALFLSTTAAAHPRFFAFDNDKSRSLTSVMNMHVEHLGGTQRGSDFSLQITGNLMLGTNACRADGFKARFEITRQDDIIYVTPIREGSKDQICNPLFEPVFEDASIEVDGNLLEIEDVVVQNVGRIGRSVSVLSVLHD